MITLVLLLAAFLIISVGVLLFHPIIGLAIIIIVYCKIKNRQERKKNRVIDP